MMFKYFGQVAVACSLFSTVIFAGPKIEFDIKTFKCGSLLEGKVEKAMATFVVKNTGDSVLTLTTVRPGCGCTMVKYDSLIAPGKTGKIESAVTIKGIHGAFSKAVTVTSTGTNDPNVRLMIEGTVLSLIELSESFITLEGGNKTGSKTVYVSSMPKDLKITEISFKANDLGGNSAWQSDLTLPVNFKWTPMDSTRADGYKVGKLDITAPAATKSMNGEFILKTNCSEKPVVKISASITVK
jgi:hypothetical protein